VARVKLPSTPALRLLRAHSATFEVAAYTYVERGGTAASSAALGVDEHRVIKTLLFEDEDGHPLVILMHGDRSVSAKALARLLGVKRVGPCAPKVAQRHSGYPVGGTSPFGTRTSMPVYMESSIAALASLYINAGARGLLVRLAPQVIVELLAPTLVEVGIP